MRAHEAALTQAGVRVVYPPKARKTALPPLDDTRTVVSEENLLGGMRGCVLSRTLYPDAADRLRELPAPLRATDTVYLSIRDLAEWWISVIAFGAKMGHPLPRPKILDAISRAPRGWSDVVEDILAALPKARLVVRDFGWLTDDPAAQLARLTGWEVWNDLPADPGAHNIRPDARAMAAALIARGDLASLAYLPEDGAFAPFDAEQTARLNARYTEDLRNLATDDRIKFWI